MSNICILITSEYPYKTQEQFLEDEIRFLGKEFDSVHIFSLDRSKDEPATRPIPENMTSTPIGKFSRGSKLRMPVYTLKGMLHRSPFPEKTTNLKQQLMKNYISGKSGSEAKIILKHLEQILKAGDHICIYSYWFFNHAMIACRLKKALQKKGYVVKAFSRAHRYDIYAELNSVNYIPYQKPMLSVLDGVYSCSEDGRRYIVNKYGKTACSNKVHVSRLGTLEHGVHMQEDFTKLHFVTCSRLSDIKRVSLFAKAFVLFHQEMQKRQNAAESDAPSLENSINPGNIHWTCMGGGEEYEEICSIIEKAGLTDCVTFTGMIAHDDVIQFYKDHEVTFFVNVSTSEGVPVSIMEAQSFGIPVLATDVGGTAEIVNEENGHLLPVELTPETLSQVMLQEYSEDSIRKKQRKSRNDWEKNSFADTLYSQWCGFLGKSIQ